MRKLARIAGSVWMAAALVAGVILVGGGFLRGRSLLIYLVFGAALPGIMAYRWGRGLAAVVPSRQVRTIRAAPTRLIDAAHELKLADLPAAPLVPPEATPSRPDATRPPG